MHPKDRAQMMAYLTRPGMAKGGRIGFASGYGVTDSKQKLDRVIGAYRRYRRGEKNPKLNFQRFFEIYAKENFADGGRIGFKYGSIPEALKKLIEDGDTNFENMPALKDKIEEMTGKRPAGSFQKGQANYGPLLEKFTFEKFKTKKKYKPEEYVVEDQKKLTKKIEKLNKKYKLKNKGINVTQQVTATGKPILEIQANAQVYGQVGRQAPPSIDGFNDIESELKKITKTDTFKNYDKSAAMKKGGEKAAAKMINPNKRPVFDYVLKNPNSTVDQITKALDLKKGVVTKTLQDLYVDMYKRLGDQGAVYFKRFDSKDIVSVADSIKNMDIDLKDRIKQLVTDAYKGDKNLKPLLKKVSDFYAIQNKIKKTEYGKFFAGNLDHAVPLTFIRQLDEGADPMNLIRIKPMPEYLNQRAFKSQFDRVLGQAYATKNKEALEAIVNLQSYLPKEFGGITPDGKIKDYGAKPFSLKTNLSQADFPEIYKRVFEFIKNPELQDTFKQSKVSFKKLLSQEKQIMGQVKGLAAYMKENFGQEIVCNLSKGINCNDPRAYQKSIDQLTQKAKQGDEAARSTLTKFTNKAATAGRFIKGALGPLAIASEIAIEGGIALNKTLQTGVPLKTAFADSIFNLALGPDYRVDKEAELKKEFAKGEDFAMAQRGRRMFLPEGAPREGMLSVPEERRLKKRMEQMEQAFPTTSPQEIDEILKTQGMTIQDFGITYPQAQDFIKQDQQMQAIADAGGVANLAGGGIAKEAGDPSGAMLESMNPDSQGLPGLLKRGRKG